jgi:hypothetical protein
LIEGKNPSRGHGFEVAPSLSKMTSLNMEDNVISKN